MQAQRYDELVWTSDLFTVYLSTLKLTGTDRNVLLELSRTAGRYNRNDLGFTTRLVNNIAAAVGVGRRQTQRIIAKLDKLDVIDVFRRKVEKSRNKPNEFRLTGFLRWLDAQKKKCFSQERCHPEGDANVTHTKESLPNSPVSDERRWDVPKSGSVKKTPLETEIKENLPFEGVCVDHVMKEFRKCVADDRSPVTLHRLRRYCQKFVVFGRAPKKKTQHNPEPEKKSRPPAPKPEMRGDAWDHVTQEFYAADPAKWQVWIYPLSITVENGCFEIIAPNAYHAAYVRSHFQDRIEGILGVRLTITSKIQGPV